MEKNNIVDQIKVLLCVLIIASHSLPVFGIQSTDFYYGQWFFRFSVPFFFISTGFFFSKMNKNIRWKYIKRIAVLYAISSLFYIPLFIRTTPLRIISFIIFGYHHLWYLSALLFGLIGFQLMDWVIPKAKGIFILALVGGVLLDEYYKLFDSNFLNKLAGLISYIGGARHALFFALPMLLIGDFIGKLELQRRNNIYIGLFLLLLSLGFIEATLIKTLLGMNITLDVSIFGWMPAVPLLILGLTNLSRMKPERSRHLRKITDIVYIIHIWVLTIIIKLFAVEYGMKFFVVTVISFGISAMIIFVRDRFAQRNIDLGSDG